MVERRDPSEVGHEAGRILRERLRGVPFPIERGDLADRVRDVWLPTLDGGRRRLSDLVQAAPHATFRSPREVAEYLLLYGGLREGGPETSLFLPGSEGLADASPAEGEAVDGGAVRGKVR